MKHLLSNQKVVCCLFLFFAGIISSILQFDVVWDFLNYHYFNAWAFLNNRVGYDVGVGSLNAFFNPLPDVPLYLMIKYFNDWPRLIYFIQGLWSGAALYVLYRIVLLFITPSNAFNKFRIFLVLLIAATGNAFFLQIGSSSNEMMLAFFELLALYILLVELFEQKSGKRLPFMLSGFLLGMALGLKLTAVTYCVVSGVSLLLFYKVIKNPLKNIGMFILFGILGFLIFSGFWMLKMWEMFQNPFFPFANSVFRSEWMLYYNLTDTSFLPRNIYEFLFWPVILSFSLWREEGGMFVSDFRPFLLYLIFIYFSVKYIYLYCRKKELKFNPKLFFLIVYSLILYLIWAIFFSISRYAVALEMIGALFIVLALFSSFGKNMVSQAFLISLQIFLLFILVSTAYYSDRWNAKIAVEYPLEQKQFFSVEEFELPPNTLIRTIGNPVSAFFVRFAEKYPNIQGVTAYQEMFTVSSLVGNADFYVTHPKWRALVQEILQRKQRPELFLFSINLISINVLHKMVEEFQNTLCVPVKNNKATYVYLCGDKKYADTIFRNKEPFKFEKIVSVEDLYNFEENSSKPAKKTATKAKKEETETKAKKTTKKAS